jgi:hypothetical protein
VEVPHHDERPFSAMSSETWLPLKGAINSLRSADNLQQLNTVPKLMVQGTDPNQENNKHSLRIIRFFSMVP